MSHEESSVRFGDGLLQKLSWGWIGAFGTRELGAGSVTLVNEERRIGLNSLSLKGVSLFGSANRVFGRGRVLVGTGVLERTGSSLKTTT